MKKVAKYLFEIILPIILLFAVGIVYKKIICSFDKTFSEPDFICNRNYIDGLLLISCYSVIKFLSTILEFDSIIKRLLITIGFYCLAFGIVWFPFMLAAFFQPFVVNTFYHAFFAIIIIELIFRHFSSALFGKYLSQSSTQTKKPRM